MLVYRMQDDHNHGPFNGDPDSLLDTFIPPIVRAATHAVSDGVLTPKDVKHIGHHPPPTRDGITITSDEVCACNNLDQFFDWFPQSFIKYLEEEGYKPHVFEVSTQSVKIGHEQVAVPLKLLTPENERPWSTSS